MSCSKCGDVVTDGVVCSHCRGHLHYSCSGLQETTYRRMTTEKKDNWRCIDCRMAGQQGIPSLSDVLRELKTLRISFHELKADVNGLRSTIQDMATQWKEVNTRVEVMEARLDVVEQATSHLSSLQHELDEAKNIIAELTKENDERDQYSRRNNIEISGIPLQKGENLLSVLSNIYSKVGLTLELGDINRIHRVRRFEQKQRGPARPPAIIVQYIRQQGKDQLLAAVRARRGVSTADIGFSGPAVNIYVSDHLTPANKLLVKRARELKQKHGYAYLWIRDCKIFMRKLDSSKVIRISSEKDLSNIK